MGFTIGHAQVSRGQRTATTPIKDIMQVLSIKQNLLSHPRNLAIFVLGCNTGLRAGDLLRLKRSQLEPLADGRYELVTVEQKTKKLRRITINLPTANVLRRHLDSSTGSYVFEGQRGRLSVSYVGRLIKGWCKDAGVDGRCATHTMRKTFVRLQYQQFGTPLSVLMKALNHSSEQQTLTYVGLLAEDLNRAYSNSI